MCRTSISFVILPVSILLFFNVLYQSTGSKLDELSQGPRPVSHAKMKIQEQRVLTHFSFPTHTESTIERPHGQVHTTLVSSRETSRNISGATSADLVVEQSWTNLVPIEIPELWEEHFPVTNTLGNRVDLTLTAVVTEDLTLYLRDNPAKKPVNEDFVPDRVVQERTSRSAREDASLAGADENESVPSVKKKDAQPDKKPMSLEMKELRANVTSVLETFYMRHLNALEHSPWAIMHSLIAYGVDTQLYTEYARRKRVNAIGWLCFDGRGAGESLFYIAGGKLRARTGPGLQGHDGQFLAMLAQSKVMRDYPMRISGHEFTVEDLIEFEKLGCISGKELTFKLIGLVHYLPLEAKWKNEHGEKWDFPKLIRQELAQPVRGSACGGTHRMMGFSYAVRTREKKSTGKLKGEWRRAKQFVEDYHKYAFSLQNRDGSFSSNWFTGRGDWGDVHRKLETTGHMLEWLVYSLPQERLEDPRVTLSVKYLATLMKKHRDTEFKIGPQGHALRALALYEHRVFSQPLGKRHLRFARNNVESSID